MSSFFKFVKFKIFDAVIFVIFAAILACSIVYLRSSNGKKASLIITTNRDEFIYDLNKDRVIKVEGVEGISTVEIKDGRAFFTDSTCPNKTCVHSTPISHNFEWIGCLPNHVFIRIEKDETEETTDADSF